MVRLNGYTLYRRDRGGRGVAYYLHNSLNAKILETSNEYYCCKPKFIIAEISSPGFSNLLLAVVYRPPNIGYLQEFEDIFSDLQTNYNHSVIIGDFNTDMLVDTYDSVQLTTFVEASALRAFQRYI